MFCFVQNNIYPINLQEKYHAITQTNYDCTIVKQIKIFLSYPLYTNFNLNSLLYQSKIERLGHAILIYDPLKAVLNRCKITGIYTPYTNSNMI
jgi:hypothetical protein